jgi:hypothetical protein
MIPLIVHGKGEEAFAASVDLGYGGLVEAQNHHVKEYRGAVRPQVSGVLIQVVNDTAMALFVKIQSDCKSVDFVGCAPSADLWFIIGPDQVQQGWIIYNCDFKLNVVITRRSDAKIVHNREWKPIGREDAGTLQTLVLSDLLGEMSDPPVSLCKWTVALYSSRSE